MPCTLGLAKGFGLLLRGMGGWAGSKTKEGSIFSISPSVLYAFDSHALSSGRQALASAKGIL